MRDRKNQILFETVLVIIILTLIIITTLPIIKNIIKTSNETAIKSDAYAFFSSVETSSVIALMNNNSFDISGLYEIKNGVLIKLENMASMTKLTPIIKGTIPESGLIELDKNGNIIRCYAVKIKKYYINFNNNNLVLKNKKILYKLDSYIMNLSEKNDEVLIDNTFDKNYRYYGDNPNNYIKINNIIYRIIGLMNNIKVNNKYKNLIKIVSDEPINKIIWDKKINDWSNSSLMNYLNGDYLKKLKFIPIEVKWNLGAPVINKAITMYSQERKKANYDNYKTTINNKIGLIYPSDYLYSYEEKCWDNIQNNCQSWIKNGWTISSSIMNSYYVVNIHNNKIDYDNFINPNDAYPSFYINSDTIIYGGNGNKTNPFIIKI